MGRFVLDNTRVPYEVFLKQQGKKEEQDDVGSHPSTGAEKEKISHLNAEQFPGL